MTIHALTVAILLALLLVIIGPVVDMMNDAAREITTHTTHNEEK